MGTRRTGAHFYTPERYPSMISRLVYMRTLADELYRGCQNRLKCRSTSDERARDRKLWSLTKAILNEYPADDAEPITNDWLLTQDGSTVQALIRSYVRFDNLYVELHTGLTPEDAPRRCLLIPTPQASIELRPIKTRGEFRRLLTTLNLSTTRKEPEPLVSA